MKKAMMAAIALYAAGNVQGAEAILSEIAKHDIENMDVSEEYVITQFDINEEGEV